MLSGNTFFLQRRYNKMAKWQLPAAPVNFFPLIIWANIDNFYPNTSSRWFKNLKN